MPRVLEGSYGGGRFLMGEVPLYTPTAHILQVHIYPRKYTFTPKVHILPRIQSIKWEVSRTVEVRETPFSVRGEGDQRTGVPRS